MDDWRRRFDAGEGERFADGHMADVTRLDDYVVRSRSTWSEASHAVLKHLEAHGFSGAPRLIDTSEDHEVLTYLPGNSIGADLDDHRDNETLVTVARAIRSLHRVLSSFEPQKGLAFPEMPGAPAGGTSVCHNDLAPWNTIMQDNGFVGFVDWDLVTLATPAWDLAYAARVFVPLYADDAAFGNLETRSRRLKLFLDAYGFSLYERRTFVDLVRQRQVSGYEMVEQWGKAGLAGFDRLYRQGLHLGTLDDLAWLDARHDELQRAILA